MNRVEIKGKIKIIDNEYVLKKEDSLYELENYLKSRNYDGFIPILNRDEAGYNKYPYKENYSLDKEQLGIDMAGNLALLHNKTSYKKEVGDKKNKEIYENLSGYIKYLDDHFKELLTHYEYIEFPSPSNLLYMSNYSKIKDVLAFCKSELDNWYKLVKGKTNERVALIHGNPKLEHAIYSDHLYLSSWRNARFDTPVVDIIKFYNEEWNNLDFTSILSEYLKKCELLEDERKLLFINIALPNVYSKKKSELDNVVSMNQLFEYIYRTENLIRPYYAKKQEEK